jgi:glycosyltransferase involved in cell wall biosynthesis
MPAYRPNPEWLIAAISSLNAQSYPHWQLVLSLDGEDPATLAAFEIARNTVAKDHKLILVQGQRSGITGALNRGLAACNTPYTARLDADDICRPRRLEKQIRLLENNPSLVGCGMQIQPIDEDSKPLLKRIHRYPTTPTSTVIVGAIFNTPIAHPVMMVRTDQVKNLGGYMALPCMEDYNLMARLCHYGDLTNLAETGLDYRVHKEQHSRKLRPRRCDLLDARWRFLQQLQNRHPAAVALVGLPLLLYAIGPRGEYRMRRLAHRFSTILLKRH